MPKKIKILWVACVLIIFSGFVYFSFMKKVKVYQLKEEARSKQESLENKKASLKVENNGNVFKMDPIKEIKELNALGKYDAAVKYAEGVAMLNPNQPKIYTWWGISLVKAGNRELAIKKFVKSANLDSSYSKTYLYWGLTLAMSGDSEGAIKKYKKVLELEPDNSNAYAYWGAALDKLGKYVESVEKLEYALEINPSNFNVFSPLVVSLYHQKKYSDAWDVVKKAKKAKVTIPKSLISQLTEVFPKPIN
jgi:tetratricopeptide (TPR) repeat protein